jgi:hypothetical protein
MVSVSGYGLTCLNGWPAYPLKRAWPGLKKGGAVKVIIHDATGRSKKQRQSLLVSGGLLGFPAADFMYANVYPKHQTLIL